MSEQPDGTAGLQGAIGASNEEINPNTGRPYVRSKETRERIRAGWAKRREQATSGPVDSPAPSDLEPVTKETPDVAPGEHRPRGRRKPDRSTASSVPAFRAGPIAKGMNSLYARVGKFVRVWDPDLGGALIVMTRKESEDDVTVGEAWEELARTNPRIRAFLLRMIEGGAWGQLLMAHMPLVIAIMMKPSVSSRIPLLGLLGASLADEDMPPGGPLVTGLTENDLLQAMDFMARMQPPRPQAGRAPDGE